MVKFEKEQNFWLIFGKDMSEVVKAVIINERQKNKGRMDAVLKYDKASKLKKTYCRYKNYIPLQFSFYFKILLDH